jgi:hypothetical protein
MATLVLTALGSVIGATAGGVGASIGAAVGALAGQSVDALIFRPAGREGPRLTDLQVQTSRYGAAIPRIHGTLRVAGTVIWSTDLQERSATSGGGKGQPSVTTYSYGASFAVALSSRAILGVRRIWADGNLLRGAAGDFKAPLGSFRLNPGNEDQTADPLIAAAVGPDHAPAYRGCAYALFEDLDLADFGNRIPSLTFEIIADAAPPTLDAILADLAGRPIGFEDAEPAPALVGLAGAGTLDEAIATLLDLHGLRWREVDGAPMLTGGIATARELMAAQLIRSIDGEPGGAAISKRRSPVEAVPLRLALRHHDPARDYQLGIQTALRPGPGAREEALDLPAAMRADDARSLVDRALRARLLRRQTVGLRAGWSALDLAVGDVVTLSGEPGRWRVEASDWEDMAVRLTLSPWVGGTRPATAAGDSGVPLLQNDLVQGPTRLAIVELPGDGASTAMTPLLYAAATGADAGWRRAALFRYRPDAGIAAPIGRTAPRAVTGTALSTLGAGPPWRFDRRSRVDILLDNAADALVSASDEALLRGANLCQIGDELLQFGAAEPIGPGRYRLSMLARGWRGTEWAISGHGADERFVLVEAERLTPVPLTPGDLGQSVVLRASGSGDALPAEAARIVDGRALLPPAPVHGRVAPLPGGDLAIGWTRRSRLGWVWSDGGDAPLGEEVEAYRTAIMAGDVALREWQTDAAALLYLAADIAADAIAAAPAAPRIEIRQTGTWGMSRPLLLALP